MRRFLLDTHTILWYLEGSANLPSHVRNLIEQPNHEILVSNASWWELGIKLSIGRLQLGTTLPQLMQLAQQAFINSLPITAAHILYVSQLAYPANGHRAPFDRLLIAQAITEDLILVSRDGKFSAYPVQQQF